MNNPATAFPTLAQQLWPVASRARTIVLVVVASVLLTLSAKVQVPFYPVPMTLQTFVVLGLGFALGPRLAMAAVALYLAQGAMGLPVFAGTPEKGIGVAYMMGPTGGYLLGFVLAAGLTGRLAQRGWDRNVLTTAMAMALGNAVIYASGLAWMGSLFGWDKPILEWGLYPFLAGDAFKLALAAGLAPLAWKALKPKNS